MPCCSCSDPARCDRAGLCQCFRSQMPSHVAAATETITWRPVAPESMPDADLVVNVAIVGGEEPVWLGAFDGDVWRDTEGMQINVTHWAPMLVGPAGVGAAAAPEVTDAMVDAYLQANDAYWKRTDELPTAPNKWRTGTPREATRESLRAALGVDVPVTPSWVRLADSDWVNIVNAPSVLDPMKDKEEAVREAVKLTEEKLRLLNVGPWCCKKGRAAGVEVCRECAEASAGYLAAMSPHGGGADRG
jgi:hypothetical protein